MTDETSAIQFELTDQDIILSWHPDLSDQTLTQDEVLAGLNEAGFGDCQIDLKAIEFLIASQQRLGRQARQVKVARQIPSQTLISIADNGLQAWLTVTKAWGLAGPTRPVIEQALRAEGLVYGVQTEALQKFEQQGFLEKTLIAEGLAPVAGHSAWFEYLVEEPEADALADLADVSGEAIDHRQRREICSVDVDQVLMRKHEATEGQKGISVYGLGIPATAGRDFSLQASPGSRISEGDPHLLIADREGRPIRMSRSVRVDNVLVLEAVDYESGHINFKGSVHIRGTVSDGFHVCASGDIIVQGAVEDAVLEAGNHISIKGGMFGKERARLSAGGNIWVTFVKSSEIDCLGDLHVKEGLFFCQARVLGEILAGVKGGKGQLNGGHIRVGKRVIAQIIGSHASTTTLLSLGEDPYLRQKMRDMDHNLRFYKSELEQVVKSIIYLRTRAAQSAVSLEELEQRRAELLESVNLLSEQVQALRIQLESSRYDCELIVRDSLMSGSQIQLAEQRRNVEEDLPACRLHLVQDDLRDYSILVEYQ